MTALRPCACGCGELSRGLYKVWHRVAKTRPKPCACGCGQLARGRYKRGHGTIHTYRYHGGDRKHRTLAVRALGRPLPPGAEVHHADGSQSETTPLVICQDRAYHKLLHQRMRVQRAGGNPNMHWLSKGVLRTKRFCEMCDVWTRASVCRACGAPTLKAAAS